MIKTILCIIAGFMLHKTVHEIYDYYWWMHSKECYAMSQGVTPHVPNGIAVRDACFDARLGTLKYAPYILMRPMLGKNEFHTPDSGWGF